MTAAGVQTIDFAAYVPQPPSTSSPDAKAPGGADRHGVDAKAGDSQGKPSDFQTELELQQRGTPKPASRKTGISKTEFAKAGSSKTDSGKSDSGKTATGKISRTGNAPLEDPNVAAVTAQVTEPQKQVLPLVLALPKPEENPASDNDADKLAELDENLQPAQQAEQAPLGAMEIRQPAEPKQAAKARDFAKLAEQPLDNSTSAKPDLSTTTDSTQTSTPPPREIPVRDEITKSKASSPTFAKPTAPSEGQPVLRPVLRDDVTLPASPPEPLNPAVSKTEESASTNASTLAFAARLTASSQNTDQPDAANATQAQAPASPAASSQTSAQIPVRYAPTAQILTNISGTKLQGTKEDEEKAGEPKKNDEPKKDEGILFDRSLRAGPRAEVRTDMVRTDMVPQRFEGLREAASSPAPAAPQQPAASARLERILETPEVKPAPSAPASGHDIRVRIPDNNGGSTQVRFVESRGEVRVSVRTADEGLAQNLRGHLNDLTQKLSDGGMPAEIWKPAPGAASASPEQHQPGRDGRGSGGQGSGSQGQQQDRQQKRPAWLEQMEASLHGNQD